VVSGANPEHTSTQRPSRPETQEHEPAGQAARDGTSRQHLRHRIALDAEVSTFRGSSGFSCGNIEGSSGLLHELIDQLTPCPQNISNLDGDSLRILRTPSKIIQSKSN
jgi:hypothetical protein